MSLDTEFNLQQLKLVDHASSCLICGYIHEIEELFTLTVPDLISVICTFYYYQFESFIPENCGPDILIDGNCAEYKKGHWNTVYGNVIIDGSAFPNAIYKWTLRLFTDPYLNIGICNNFIEMVDNPFNEAEYESYAINNEGMIKEGTRYWSSNGIPKNKRFKANDIITMEVNMRESTISFHNHDLQMIQMKIENIYTSKFKLTICLSQCAVELMDFQFALDNSINEQ